MASSGGADVPKKVYKKMWVERSAGSELAQSRRVEGAHAPFARGETGIREQVILHDRKPKTSGGSSGALTEFLTDVAVAAAVMGAQAFIEKGIPAIKQRLADRREQRGAAKTVEPPPAKGMVIPNVLNADDGIGSEVAETGAEVETQQWYQLFFESIAHRAAGNAHHAISAEKWMFLASARIVDDEETQALASAMRELSPEQLAERLDRVLEQHPELMTEDPASVMKRLFGEEGDGRLTPIPAPIAGDQPLDVPKALPVEESDAARGDEVASGDHERDQ
jgi:hypothetical protein